MPRAAHLTLPEELRELVKAQVRAEQRAPGFLGDDPDDELPEVDEEEALFADHDHLRGHGRGVYVFDDEEAASRRIDLEAARPEPPAIALPPADEDAEGIVLSFEPEAGEG